ncbi:saccharopine dehydrogenase family protein [Haloechinothrix salitolerans]|uniref:Saccharopine dehydrogenase NADP-binding domain-containing protein n=1 Tax=Haloechinothrix salitolerans TaxID=926830 RepID=A0ABW2C4Z5_9PSEU
MRTTQTRTTGPAPQRVLVIGGAGEMGTHTCGVLAGADEIAEVIIADRDIDRARELAATLGVKATPLQLDLTDSGSLKEALGKADIVLNTAGPFYLFGKHVLNAAIEAGTTYLDICDDWEPTLDMLQLDDAARAAGVTAVIGLGASPGISNLLAALAMSGCDTVERAYTCWRANGYPPVPEGTTPPEATAAVVHWVHNLAATIKVWRGGKLADAEPLEERRLAYPGWGEESVWVCGHPEPLTLGRVRPELKESLNVMSSRPLLMEALIKTAGRVRSGELTVPEAANALVAEPNTMGRAAGTAPNLPVLFGLAEGIKDGRPVRVGARPLAVPNASMGTMTGIPLAVGALMAARGEVTAPGVHGPEGAIDPAAFFQLLAEFADQGTTERQDVVEVVSDFIGA